MAKRLIEELLNEAEGASLDFKRDQYPFVSDEEKGELLKDILAFANAWRRDEAYLLIGVDEVKGGRSRPVGITQHFDDANLQQFVNSKTQKPISFSYYIEPVDSVEIGVIRLPLQERPFFLRADFGLLKKDVVYVRQGSSTSTANPDEIARMGLSQKLSDPPDLSVTATVVNALAGEFVVAISNSGAGIARAPYLKLNPPAPFRISQYGLDGNIPGKHGLPLLPQGSGLPSTFSSTTDVVVHPGTAREITKVEWRGERGKVPNFVDMPYTVGAEDFGIVSGTLHVAFHS